MSTLYFAYGSNMSLGRMRQFIPQANPIGPGQLLDHSLGFTTPLDEEFRRQWGGAPANVYRKQGQSVWGVVYDVAETQFSVMDKLEQGYQRVLLPVLVNEVVEEMWLYKLFEERFEDREQAVPKPGRQYMRLLIEGARQHALPREYIEFLGAIETEGNADLGDFHQSQHT
uniref:gamma-glutamylcyclotransferase n=1 Tax=Biomphalaria glabrata TaxID=6526 RepID=A0A2C9LSG9_BIOGL